MNNFEKDLSDLLLSVKHKYTPKLFEAMEYALKSGGKRIRPNLCFLSAEFCNVPRENVLPHALAIECIHTYSLIHDDMPCMDNDVLRRGKPTVHVKFGEAMALLAGDALMNLAYEILFRALENDQFILPSCQIIANAAGAEGMIGGQAMEFSFDDFNEERLIELDNKKTGGLIRSAVYAPSLQSHDYAKVQAMNSYGKYAGLAFQLADDLIDADKKEKTSYVTVCGKEKTIEMLNKLYDLTKKALSPWGKESEKLLDFFQLLAFRDK